MNDPSDDDPSEAPDADLDALYARVRADVETERGARAWLRARPTSTRAAILGLTVVGSVAAAIAALSREGFWEDRGPGWALSLTGLLALVALAVGSQLRPVHQPAWSGPIRGLVASALVLGSLGAIVLVGDGALGRLGSGMCLAVGGLVGVPVFAVATLLDREPRRGALFAGLSGAIVGALAVQALCGAPGMVHLVVEHFGVVALFGALFGAAGWLLGRRVPSAG